MKSKEEIIAKYNFICDPDVLETVEAMMEEYQQSQPSGMRWVREKPANDREFVLVTASLINGEWHYHGWEIIEVPDGYFALCELHGEEWGPYEDLSAEYYLVLSPVSESSPAGAAEGASEGISKIREVMNWISQCVDEDHDLEVSEIKMIWNDLSDAISLIESTPHSSEGMAGAVKFAKFLADNDYRPGSGNKHWFKWNGMEVDETPLTLEQVYQIFASLSPGVEDGSGWVKVEDRLPGNAGWVNDTVMFWSKKHGHALIGCYDFEFDDWTQQPWTEGAEKLKSSDVTHWRPLPTPPDVEDNQTKKQ